MGIAVPTGGVLAHRCAPLRVGNGGQIARATGGEARTSNACPYGRACCLSPVPAVRVYTGTRNIGFSRRGILKPRNEKLRCRSATISNHFQIADLKIPQFSIFNSQLSIFLVQGNADKQCLSLRAGLLPVTGPCGSRVHRYAQYRILPPGNIETEKRKTEVPLRDDFKSFSNRRFGNTTIFNFQFSIVNFPCAGERGQAMLVPTGGPAACHQSLRYACTPVRAISDSPAREY